MLRSIFEKIYHGLPVVREIQKLRAAQTICLIDFDLAAHPRYGDPRRLLRYYSQVCSQNGEDGMIHEIFRRIGTTNKVFVEVGVGTGVENNTAFLLSTGWSGYWIDGNRAFLRALQGRKDLNDCLKYHVGFVSKENITEILGQLGVPQQFDLFSLDIDQNTYYVWEGLSKFQPRVVVVEYNSGILPDVDWKVNYRSDRTWDKTQNFGASLKAFEMLGRQFGYSLVGCDFCGANAFFVQDALVAGKFVEPFTSENHYEPSRITLTHRRHHPSAILDRKVHAAAR